MKLFKATLALLAITFVVGCSSLSGISEDEKAKFAFQYGTLKAIDGDSAKADRLVALIEEARPYIENGETVTIGFLEAELKQRIEERGYAPEDKAILYLAISQARQRLIDRVGEGGLSSDQRLELLNVLEWIKGAARGRLSS